MDKRNILPQLGQPVIRTTAGKLASKLAELSEESLGDVGLDASCVPCACSYDGVDASCVPCACSYDGVDASCVPCACSYDD